ncbi:ABC transporter substrate-binding protein [Marinobacter sp. SS21]|uniref:ABC transporter substrate-binding protein n=1 Tax=Marinobacter sp. SS21 TaxID=2979460 RepID=UPI00232C036D|nr:ABC transporter substrate-binding protein [Marinobacter sp. SS21]MDC0661656.1 ABC transporter substrate-binding protein [Marinobacter sp. SS21]
MRSVTKRLGAAASVVVLAAVFSQAVLAVTQVQDDRGVWVSVPDNVGRVAAISTFAADTLVALGVSPVAASTFADQPLPQFLGERIDGATSLGPRAKTNLELLTAVQPDLIVAIRRYTEPYERQYERLAPYLAFNVITFEDSLRAVRQVSRGLGLQEEGERLNREFIAELERLGQAAPGGVSAALLVSSSETPFAYYDNFLPAYLLNRLKGVNVVGAAPRGDDQSLGYRISLEALLALDPDVLFVLPSIQQQAYRNNPIWPYLKAVRSGRVYEVGQHWKEGAGPIARGYILNEMAHLLYPETFPAPAMPEQIRSHSLENR